jgi:hypothetical protein
MTNYLFSAGRNADSFIGTNELMAVLKCARNFHSTCITSDPSAATQWLFEEASTEFALPTYGSFSFTYDESSTTFTDDDDSATGSSSQVENFLQVAIGSTSIQVIRTVSGGNAFYRITYDDFNPQAFPQIYYNGEYIENNLPWSAFFHYNGNQNDRPWDFFTTWLTPSSSS